MLLCTHNTKNGGNMKIIQIVGVYLLVVATASVFAFSNQADAVQNNSEVKNNNKKTYEYVAQEGDSYTKIVRKAVQTYGINNKKDIGKARIVAIETKLTESAGWPLLEIGQKVKLEEDIIAKAIENAMKLNDKDLSAWQTYVPFVDFYTNNVGESKK
jgi:hypothetical protein